MPCVVIGIGLFQGSDRLGEYLAPGIHKIEQYNYWDFSEMTPSSLALAVVRNWLGSKTHTPSADRQ